MSRKIGIKFDKAIHFECQTIAFDKSGLPWLIDPAAGTVQLAKLIAGPEIKQSAVKKRKNNLPFSKRK